MIVLGWFLGSLLAAWLAHDKGRNALGFFLVALLLSPLVGVLAALGCREHAPQARVPYPPIRSAFLWGALLVLCFLAVSAANAHLAR